MTEPDHLAGLRRQAHRTRQRGLSNRLAVPPLLQRFDPALVTVLALVVAVGIVAGLGWASVERWRGFFDAPVVRAVVDKRVLADFRSNPSPLVDAVRLGDSVVLGRKDGNLHVYDVPKELFADGQIPRSPNLTGHLSILSQGCGDRVQAGMPPCPVAGTVFAVTDKGGLARMDAGRWQVVLGDEAWIGRDGKPVQQADIVAWAASDDGRHVLALAGAKGTALFDQRTAGWAIVPGSGDDATKVVFANSAFWLGGTTGLQRVEPAAAPVRKSVPGAEGQILDLDAVADGVAVLRLGACERGTGCLAILQVSGDSTVSLTVGEREIVPLLSDQSIDHATLQDGKIVVLGKAGVHVYNPELRNWQQVEAAAVDAFYATADDGIMFAAGARFAVVSGGTITLERKLANPLVQIMADGADHILGFDRTGTVMDMTTDPPTALTFNDAGKPEGASFTAGATLGDVAVVIGPQGILLLNTRTRRYAFQTQDGLPAELSELSQFRLVSSGQTLWFVDLTGGRAFWAEIAGVGPAATIVLSRMSDPGMPFRSAQPDGRNLTVVTSDGGAYSITPDPKLSPIPLIGAALPGPIRPAAITAVAGGLVFAAGGQLWHYDGTERAWKLVGQTPEPVLRDLGMGQSLYALGSSGTVYQANAKGWAEISGGGPQAVLSSSAVTDAANGSGILYLGGNGSVQQYDPAARRFGTAWSGGTGAVRLVGVAGNLPFWTSNGHFLSGDTMISDKAETVLGAWSGLGEWDYLADSNGRRHAVSLDGDFNCMFLGSDAPTGNLIDARALPDGRVIALTDRGVGLHDANLRRWIAVEEPPAAADTRIEIIAGYLVRQDKTDLSAVPLESLPNPDDCSNASSPLKWVQSLTLASTVIDKSKDQVLMLGTDGAVSHWHGRTTQSELPATSVAPNPANLLRVYADGANLAFAAKDAIWRYDIKQRIWRSSAFQNPPPNVTEVDLTLQPSGPATVTLWTADGLAWGGTEVAAGVLLQPLTLPPLPRIELPPDSITDMGILDSTLGILGQKGLQLVSQDDMATLANVGLPDARTGWSLARHAALSGFVLVDGDRSQPDSIHVVPGTTPSGPVKLADVSWAYAPGSDRDWGITSDNLLWRITPDLQLWRCEMKPRMTAPDGCNLAAGVPLEIARDTIRAGIPVDGGVTLLLSDDKLMRLGPDLRPAGEVSGPAIADTARLYPDTDGPLLWEGQGRALWRITADGAVKIADGVAALRVRQGGNTVETADGLLLVQGTALSPPELSDGEKVFAATVDGAAIVGLDETGAVRKAELAADPDDLVRLPTSSISVVPGRLTDLAEGNVSGYWSQAADGAIRFDWTGSCKVAKPVPPVAKAGDGFARAERRFVLDTPPPPPFACVKSVQTGLTLDPLDRVLSVTTSQETTSFVTALREIKVVTRTWAVQSSVPLPAPAQPSTLSKNSISGAIAVLDGKSYLAPPKIDGSRPGLLAISGMANPLTSPGTTTLDPWSALDLPALSWDRASRGIRFGDPSATPMPLAKATVDGVFLPAHPGKSAYLGASTYAWANEFGLWSVETGKSVRTVQLGPLGPVRALAHGVFLLDQNGMNPQTGAAVPDVGTFALSLGSLTVAEDLRARAVTASLIVSGQPQNAFGRQGFAFDQRRAISRLGAQTMLLTPLGLVPAASLTGALAVPDGTEELGLDGDDLLARQGARWQKYDGSGWNPHDAPGENAVLATSAGVVWQRVQGTAGVVPADPAQHWRTDGQGLSFDMDRIVALAADQAGVVAITGIGTETAATLTALGTTSGPVARDPGATTLDALVVSPGQTVLWAQTASGPLAWDPTAAAWRAPEGDEQPWNNRLAVQIAGIEIAFTDQKPQVSVAVTGLDGQTRQTPFDWAGGGHMPFDTVRALHVEADSLVLGTDFGLRLLTEQGPSQVNTSLYATGTTPPEAVLAVGRPESAPGTILAAAAGGGCVMLAMPTAAPQPCADAAPLSERLVIDDSLWRWTKDDGQVSGAYHLADGNLILIPGVLHSRMPHDNLSDRVNCNGTEAELWADPAVAAILDAGLPTRLDGVEPAAHLLCQPQTADLGQSATLQPGLYAAGQGAVAHQGLGWTQVSAAIAAGVIARVAGDIVADDKRLRLRLTQGAVIAELRRLDDVWHDVSWADGRIALDVVKGIARGSGGIQLLTPAGFVPVRNAADLTIDPATVVVATPPDPTALRDCALDRIEIRDGSEQAVPADTKAPLAVRCLDGRIFAGAMTSQHDVGALQLLGADPFVSRVLVDQSGLWTWARIGSTPGKRGSIAITFKGESLALSGGRLAIDEYRSVAIALTGFVDIVSANGWWRQKDRSMALAAAERPKGFAAAPQTTSVWSDLDDTGPVLCVKGSDAETLDHTGRMRRVNECRDVAGSDTIWTWWQSGGGPLATGTAANGVAMSRMLLDGRFSDLIVTGAPSAQTDGEITAPTATGAILIGDEGPKALYVTDAGGVLTRGAAGTPMLVNAATTTALGPKDDLACAALPQLLQRLPADAVLRRVEMVAPLEAMLWADIAGKRQQFMIACDAVDRTLVWADTTDVAGRARFQAFASSFDAASPTFVAHLQDGNLDFRLGDNLGLMWDTSTKGAPIALISAQDGRATLLVTTDDVYRAETDPALRAIVLAPVPLGPLNGVADPSAVVSAPETPVPQTAPLAPASPPTRQATSFPKPQPQPQPQISAPPPPDTDFAKVLTQPEIKAVQAALAKLGYSVGKADGIIGKRTVTAISQWQVKHGLGESGILTVSQHDALLQEAGQ
jgi:hypothetical protein